MENSIHLLSYERANYEHFYTTEDDRIQNWGKESWDEAKRQTKWCADGERFVKNTDTISVYIKNCRTAEKTHKWP